MHDLNVVLAGGERSELTASEISELVTRRESRIRW
jgi:hypothetical protein